MNSQPANECKMAPKAAEYVSGELSGAEIRAFREHTNRCSSCRNLVKDFSTVKDRLLDLPETRIEEDLSAAVLRRLHDGRTPSPLVFFPRPAFALAAAAVLAILMAGAALIWSRSRRETESVSPVASSAAVAESLQWLAGVQEPDGGWDPSKWGGKRQYACALTGMALLAFLNGPDETIEGTGRKIIRSACRYLVDQQAASGRFGPEFDGMMYNQGMASSALIEACRRLDDKSLEAPVRQALAFIRNQQLDSGGWGYRKAPSETANLSVTAWQIRALVQAEAAGQLDGGNHLNKALFWLAGTMDERGRFGYQQAGDFPDGSETLTAMGALCLFSAGKEIADMDRLAARTKSALMRAVARQYEQLDYYRQYFLVAAAAAGSDDSLENSLADLKTPLIERRVKSGSLSGTWQPDDTWSSAGGRLYTTCMATLSLEIDSPRGI
ncbi:MAG: zf-HC2 domain-containing protein [Kiritimatiellia bacterium]